MFAPWDPKNDVVVGKAQDILRDKYDIDVKLENVYVEYQQYQELMNVRIAGGTAPDIWLGQNQSGILNYYKQGVIAEWDRSFFEENAPNMTAYINKGGARGDRMDLVDTWWQGACIAPSGKMITFPGLNGKTAIPKGIIYRGDWIDNLGIDPKDLPSDIDDFTALMYRFVNDDPNKSGKKDTYAFSTSIVKYFFSAYGIYTGFVNTNSAISSLTTQWYMQPDGVVRNGDILPGAKEALARLQKLYADGLIDPEFITGENTGGYWAINQGFINGLYGVSGHASFGHYEPKEVQNGPGGPVAQEYWAVNGEDSKFYFGPWITGPDGEHGHYIDNDYGLGESYVYNADLEQEPEKLAAIFKIMDAFNTDDDLSILATYGIEGETFKYNEFGGVISLLENTELNDKGVMALRGLYGPNNPFNEKIVEIGTYNNPSNQYQLELQKQPNWDSYLQSAIKGFPPSESTYAADLVTYRDETWISIIKGELPVDAFDTFVEEWLARGGQVLQDEVNEMYKEQNP